MLTTVQPRESSWSMSLAARSMTNWFRDSEALGKNLSPGNSPKLEKLLITELACYLFRSDSGIFETQVYAYMKTFRFTGSPALYIECDVRMCHGRCPVSLIIIFSHFSPLDKFWFQSQPCHWRNLKGVTKREAPSEPANSTLSDNISLFQSIRVLQDEDEPSVRERITSSELLNESLECHFLTFHFAGENLAETCIRTSVLSAISATFAMLLCILVGTLFVACTRLRSRKNENLFFDSAYVGHKGQID